MSYCIGWYRGFALKRRNKTVSVNIVLNYIIKILVKLVMCEIIFAFLLGHFPSLTHPCEGM